MGDRTVTKWGVSVGVIVTKFIREIPENRIVQKEINNLEAWGFTLVWTKDSVCVYADVADNV